MQSAINNFYNNQNILVTGGTGFLGKVLVEKLLRSTDVASIYVLTRPKKGQDAQTRFDEIFNTPLFARVKIERPDFKTRVVLLDGDHTKINLNLPLKCREELLSKINVVFHVAATVNFDENLKTAFNVNVKGTENVLSFCKKCHHLKSFVHVSTAFCNWKRNHEGEIDEIVYDCPLHYKKVEAMLEDMSSEEAHSKTAGIIGAWPNTYTFTKALSEVLVEEHFEDLPVGIFRPGGVISSCMEPIKYWKDSLGAPCSLIAFAALGYSRLFVCDYHHKIEAVPVDMTVAALIASAWDVTNKNTKVPVYNYISSNDNPINVYDFIAYCSLHMTRYPLSNAVWAPRLKIVDSFDEFKRWTFWYHFVPALLMDLISLLCFKKPQFFSRMRKINNVMHNFAYFSTRGWPYSNKNVREMWNKMDETDRELFCFDLTKVNWLEQIRNVQKSLRIYRFKDPLSTLPQAKTRLQRFEAIDALLPALFYFILIFPICKIFEKIFF
ncbi:hypothetical protein MTP99_006314 [Tenebrio molitor]|nr:hypothetical protein MTP99_006314 [Tenebrio molitor]